MKKMKKSVIIALLGLITLGLAGCNGTSTLRTVVENAYAVVIEGDSVLEKITVTLEGSTLGDDVSEYVVSLDLALDAIAVTLERVAVIIGANLTTLSSAGEIAESTDQLDSAVDVLLESIK